MVEAQMRQYQNEADTFLVLDELYRAISRVGSDKNSDTIERQLAALTIEAIKPQEQYLLAEIE